MALNALECSQFLGGITAGHEGLPSPFDLFENVVRLRYTRLSLA